MADREYRILVSYALARNSGAVFQDAETSSARARAKIEGDGKAIGDALGRGGKKGTDLLGKGFDDAVAKGKKAADDIAAAFKKAADQEAKDAERAAQAKVKAEQRSFDQRLRLAEQASKAKIRLAEQENRQILADVERAARQEQAARDRAAKADTRGRERNLGSFASGAYQNMTGAASRAMGVANTIASGMGVKLDLGTQIAASGEFRRSIVDVTNAGMGIQGKLANKGDYASTTSAVEGAADATKIDQNTIAQGLSVFVDKASDIESGKKMLKGLGDIAQASGTDFVELAGSAGEFFKMMSGEGPEKIEKVQHLLALAAKQGQVGNLAFKELAPTIGKLAAQGQKISGSYVDNLGDLMALSQVSLKGGAAKGAEANRAAQAFVMDLTKQSSLKTFSKNGVKVFEDQNAQGGGTILRQMEPLITELIRKSGGDIKTISNEFKGMKSQAVMTGFLNTFRDAGGTAPGGMEKGLAAVAAEFKKYREPMSQAEIQNSAGAVREGADAKAAAFNNQLERIAGSLAERVLPQMEKLGPKLLELVEAFSKVVGWAAENPGLAITAAIVGSIAQSALGTVVSTAIANLIRGGAGGGGGGAGAGVGGVVAGGVAGAVAGYEFVAHEYGKMEGGADAATAVAEKTGSVIAKALAEYKSTGTLSADTKNELDAAEAGNKTEMKKANSKVSRWDAWNPFSSTTMAEVGEKEGAEMNKGTMSNQNSVIEQLLNAPAKKQGDAADKLSAAADKLSAAAAKFPGGGGAPGGGRPGIPGHGGT